MVTTEIIEQCFSLIVEKKFQDAKNAVANIKNTKSNRVLGAASALEGLIAMQSAKPPQFPLDPQRDLLKFRRVLNERESSIWSDDFDKGYFSTWKKFLRYASEHGLFAQENSVVQNPSEEEERDKSS